MGEEGRVEEIYFSFKRAHALRGKIRDALRGNASDILVGVVDRSMGTKCSLMFKARQVVFTAS